MNDDTKWFSQTVLTFKDKSYSTDGYMRIAISTNTNDYKFFNPPYFNISISNQYSKSCNFNIQQAEDLLESFEIALQQLNGEETVIEKHIQTNVKIYFKFALTSSTNERVVVIELITSETDAVKIIVPLKPTFQSLLRRLKFFVKNYDQLCFNLLTQSINNETINIIKQLPNLIKGISSQILSQIPSEDTILDCSAQTPEPSEKVKAAIDTAADLIDLDKSMGENFDNIKIPEIEEKKIEEKASVVEMKSDFIEKVLQNNLFNIESKLTSLAVSPNPLMDFISSLESELGFKTLNNISDDDLKSLSYISTFLQKYYTKDYTINNFSVPSKTPILFFNGKKDEANVELAKDLLLIIGYMRAVRRRLESKFDNAYDNKSLIYLYTRTILDPICFSYIDHLNRTDIVSAIKNRYEYFDKNGVFDKYKQIMRDSGCTEIDSRDVTLFVEEASDNIFRKAPTIEEVHDVFFNRDSVKLPSKNVFNLEQIINEFIPLEIAVKMGSDLKNKEVLKKMKEQTGASDETIKYFTGKQKIKKTTKKEKITPLNRWVNKFKQDIPEKYRDDVAEFTKELQYNIFDFSKCEWPLEEFDERIVKALYIWDPHSDEKMKTNFEHFATLVESEIMTKEAILISTKLEDSKGWNALTDFV